MRLQTERLLLREFVPEDWQQCHLYESDPVVVRYQSFGVFTEEQSRDYIRRCIVEAQNPHRRTYDLAVALLDPPLVIGRVGLDISDAVLREGRIWYILNRDHWGNGYMPEAAKALVDFGFEKLGLRRIVADVDPANQPSIRLLEKIGFRLEAHHRLNAYVKGEWCDTLVFARLRDEKAP